MYHIHALRHVRHLLTDETSRTVACSIVGSRLSQLCDVWCSDDDDQQVAARTEQPRQGSVQVQWSDGRSTFTQIAALATDPRAYYLQGGCTDVQNSYIFNAIISLRPTPMTSSRPSRSVNTQRLQTQRTCSLVGLSNSTGALSLSPHQQCGTHCPTI